MRDEPWPYGFLPTDRAPTEQRVSEMCIALPRRFLSEKFLLLGSVSCDGIRPADLSGKPPRHRDVPAFDARQTLPHGIPRQGSALDTGRCERVARLADLRGLRAGLDWHPPRRWCTTSTCQIRPARSPGSGLRRFRSLFEHSILRQERTSGNIASRRQEIRPVSAQVATLRIGVTSTPRGSVPAFALPAHIAELKQHQRSRHPAERRSGSLSRFNLKGLEAIFTSYSQRYAIRKNAPFTGTPAIRLPKRIPL